MVEGHGMHRGGRRRARRHLDNAGPQFNLLGMSAHPGKRRQRIRAIGLGAPDRVVAEGLGALDALERDLDVRARVVEKESELECHLETVEGPSARAKRASGRRIMRRCLGDLQPACAR